MVGVGFTIRVAVIGVPTHPLAVGVIVNVTVCCTNVVLVTVPLILPEPDAAIPVTFTVLFLVHANVVPLTALVSTMGVMAVPEQTVCVAGVATAFGIGLTVTGILTAGPLHPFAEGVTVNVVVTGAFVVFVNVPLIFPVPLAAIPVTVAVLFRTQLNTVPGIGPTKVIGAMADPEQMVCADIFEPHPLMPFTVNVPVFGQAAPLNVPLMQPEATIAPPHLTSQRQELSLNAPCASIKKEKGPLVLGTNAEGDTGGLNPYGPPVKTTVPSELVTSSAKNPLPVMITCILPGGLTEGAGFTSTVAVIGGPAQPLRVGVMVKVTVIGAFVVLVNVPLILPVPFAAIPVTVATLFLVQANVVPLTGPERTIVVMGNPEQTV
jgi:hypothetical protein